MLIVFDAHGRVVNRKIELDTDIVKHRRESGRGEGGRGRSGIRSLAVDQFSGETRIALVDWGKSNFISSLVSSS